MMNVAKPDTLARVTKEVDEGIRVLLWLRDQAEALQVIARQVSGALKQGNKVLFLGNGGSAADAQHLAGELAGRFRTDRDPLPAISLTESAPSLTAIANDYGYEHAFARQVQALARPGDVVVGISTSGNSPNVLRAVEEARRRRAVTIAFTGQSGKLAGLVDHALEIPSQDVARIQEAYMVAGHLICGLVEEELYGSRSR